MQSKNWLIRTPVPSCKTCNKDWYTEWKSTNVSKTAAITEVFTEEEWDTFIMDKVLEQTKSIDVKEEPGVAPKQPSKVERYFGRWICATRS